jgi:hypothetical protein
MRGADPHAGVHDQDPNEKIFTATIPLGTCINVERNTVAAPAQRVMASHQPLIVLVAT